MRTSDVFMAVRLAVLVGCLVATTGLAVHLMAAEPARQWLGLTFPGLSRELGEALAVFANNVRLLGAVLAACLVVQLMRPRPCDSKIERATGYAVVGVCDLVLLAGCTFHIVFVGSALGAYGGRTLAALVPHGPVELGAFSLALALYVSARRERLDPRRFVSVAVACVVGLAAAAFVETYA